MDGSGEALYVDSIGWGAGAFSAFALYVVDGKGRESMSSCEGVGACDIRRPICTVADEAMDESLRCLGPPGNRMAGGGVNSLMSYIESFC